MTPVATDDRWMSAAEADRYARLREGSVRALCLLPADDSRRLPHATRPGTRGLSIFVRKSDIDAALLATGAVDQVTASLEALLAPNRRRLRAAAHREEAQP